MVKKFSYLVSVSVLASSLLSSTSHAIFEKDLIETVNNFHSRQQVVPVDSSPLPSSSSSSEDEPSSWGSSLYAGWSSAVVVAGHTSRCVGDAIRGKDSPAGDLLVNHVISYAGKSIPLSQSVTADPGFVASTRKLIGNMFRGIGEVAVGGETPTIEREIREFWLKRKVTDVEEIFTTTASVLYSSTQLSGFEIRYHYNKFIESWNNSSRTVVSRDMEKNNEYFLKGIIRGFVMNKQDISDFESDFDAIALQAAAQGITYDNFPLTRAITEETVRQADFKKFVEGTYKIESLEKQAYQARRLLSLQSQPASSIPSALPAASYPAIEHISLAATVAHPIVEDLSD